MRLINNTSLHGKVILACVIYMGICLNVYAQEAKTGVYAVSSPKGISLRISGYPLPSFKDPGFEGYLIYKRIKGEKEFNQINKKPLQRVTSIKEFVNLMGDAKIEGLKLVTQSKDDADLWTKFETMDNTLFMYGMFDLDYIQALGQFYLDSDVIVGKEYEYVMAKVKANGELSPASEIFSVKHGVFPSLEDPINTKITIDRESVKLVWDRNPVDTMGLFFNVYRSESPTATFTKINQSPIITSINKATGTLNQHSFSDTNVIKRHTYYYKILSCDLYGNTSAGANSYSITFVDLVPPPQVQSLKVLDDRNGLKLVWQPPKYEDLAGYYIYRSTTKDTGFILLTKQMIAVNDSSYLDLEVQGEKTYFYRISAVGNNGYESLPSAIVAGTQELWIIPEPPAYIDAKATDKGILVSWKPINDTLGVRGYYVYRSSAINKEFTQIFRLTRLQELEYLDTSKVLDPRGTYFYQVKAVSNQGAISPESNIAHAQPIDKVPPDAINSLTGWVDQIGIHLFWSAPTDPTTFAYQIFRKAKYDKSFSQITQSPISKGTIKYIDSDVVAGNTYEYYVIALDEKGNASDKSQSTTISTSVELAKPPYNLRLTNLTKGILVEWDESYESGVDGYFVYRKVANQEWTKINTTLIPLSKPSFTDSQIKIGVIYSYRVACVKNKNQVGLESDIIFITRSK